MANYFPMFIEIKNKPCLIIGGGRIALHKIRVLQDFGAQIQVVAPEILSEIQEMENVICHERHFQKEDLRGQAMVIAATDDREENHRISQVCREERIPMNAVDQPEDCSFIFPAYLKEGDVVAAFSSGGQSPVVTQYLKEQIRPAMTPLLGNLAECLGSLRERIRQIEPVEVRKKIYQEILEVGLEKGDIPSEEEIEEIIRVMQIKNLLYDNNKTVQNLSLSLEKII